MTPTWRPQDRVLRVTVCVLESAARYAEPRALERHLAKSIRGEFRSVIARMDAEDAEAGRQPPSSMVQVHVDY